MRRFNKSFVPWALVVSLVLLLVPHSPAIAITQRFGTQPYNDVLYWADQYKNTTYGLTKNKLAVMMLAVTWSETGAWTTTPSPMTLSRWDTDRDLFPNSDPNTPYPRAFWHPGIGLWQLDSAGLGAGLGAHQRIATDSAAKVVAQEIASRYVNCKRSGKNDQTCRSEAWKPWYACTKSTYGSSTLDCEEAFQYHYNASNDSIIDISLDTTVTRNGGMTKTTCEYLLDPGYLFDCWRVNPSNAQGDKSWTTNPNGSKSGSTWTMAPLTYPFYVASNSANEERYWTGSYSKDWYAVRQLGKNARSGLFWLDQPFVCPGGC